MGDVNYKVDEVQKTIIFEKKSKFGNVTFSLKEKLIIGKFNLIIRTSDRILV